jgi:tetratricopeptide (TPR) repeat protein
MDIRGSRIVLGLVAAVAVAFTPAHPNALSGQSSDPADVVSVRIIVVSTAAAAEDVIQRVKAGESFTNLARALSIDPSAESGGLLEGVSRSELRSELRNAVQGLRPGDVSTIVRVPTGFAVVELAASNAPAGDSPPGAPALNPGVSAVGGVKYVVTVAGLNEVLVALYTATKPMDWDQDPRTICEVRHQAMTDMQAKLERFIAPGGTGEYMSEDEKTNARFSLAQMLAYQGRMDEAIPHFQLAYDAARSKSSATLPQMEEALAVAHLKRAEMISGLYTTPGDRCLLSPRGVIAPLVKTDDAKAAIELLEKSIARKPDDLEVKWLLNIAYMMLGKYPDGVPPAYRIAPAAFAPTERVGHFVDIADRIGVSTVRTAGGIVIDDLNNDGRFDIAISAVESCAEMVLFEGNPDGTFTDRTSEAGLTGQNGALNLNQADYNNDGCVDLLLMRGGWEARERRSLLRNNCNGTFTDVTVASGLARPATKSQTAVWTDINNDGYLDLFVGNEDSRAQLFLNRKDGTFEDIAHAAGVDRQAFTKGVTAGDYDNDGWPDLYVSNIGGTSFLYHNNHDQTFTEVARAAGVLGPGQSFATWFFDYDNDGWQDLFVTSYYSSIVETVRTYLGLPHDAPTLKLYHNRRDGTFEDATGSANLDKVFMPMGANFGDIDNDGFLDIYMGTGNPSYASLVPSVLLRNHDGQRFVDVTSASGTGELHKGHGVAFADLDGDGSDEIVFEAGGATPGDAHPVRVFHNPGTGNDWIDLKLEGVKSNRSAIGAVITVTVESQDRGHRTISRTVGSGGSFGASPLRQHIGLGKSPGAVDVDVWWPTSGERQHFAHVPKNRAFEIKEFDPKIVPIPRPSTRSTRSKPTVATHAP